MKSTARKSAQRAAYDLAEASATFWRELHEVPVVTEAWLDKHTWNIASCLIYEQGYDAGAAEAALSVVLPQLEKQLGALSQRSQKKIQKLAVSKISDLGVALLDFHSRKDLYTWL